MRAQGFDPIGNWPLPRAGAGARAASERFSGGRLGHAGRQVQLLSLLTGVFQNHIDFRC